MLIDYVIEGGRLMVVLAVIFFAVLFLATYAASLLVAEVRRALRFRRQTQQRRWEIDQLHVAAFRNRSLPARYLSDLIHEFGSAEAVRVTSAQRRRRAEEIEDALLDGLVWPIEILQFLGAYAAKIGLCGTIVGLCMHFLVFGTEGSTQVAARAMAVALYTTLGALTIALVAEPTAYLLGWTERWIRKDLKCWLRFLEDTLRREDVSEPAQSRQLAPTRPIAAGVDCDGKTLSARGRSSPARSTKAPNDTSADRLSTTPC